MARALAGLGLALRLVVLAALAIALLRLALLIAALGPAGLLLVGILRRSRRRRSGRLCGGPARRLNGLVALMSEAVEDQDDDGDRGNGGEQLLHLGGRAGAQVEFGIGLQVAVFLHRVRIGVCHGGLRSIMKDNRRANR